MHEEIGKYEKLRTR